jgi:hypothetical protein
MPLGVHCLVFYFYNCYNFSRITNEFLIKKELRNNGLHSSYILVFRSTVASWRIGEQTKKFNSFYERPIMVSWRHDLCSGDVKPNDAEKKFGILMTS